MEQANITITRRLDSVLNGLKSEFKTIYTRMDFNNILDEIKKTGMKSDRPSKLKMLYEMFNVCGIEYELGKDNEYYEKIVENSSLPDFTDIEDDIVYALYSIYSEFPSPEEYMERIVDRLCYDEDGWGDDTLRIRILKQFIKYGNYLCDAGFNGRNVVRDFVKVKIGKKPSDEEVLKYLDDNVFARLQTATKAQRRPIGPFGLLKVADDLASGKFRTGGATKRDLYLFAMVYGMCYYTSSEGSNKINDIETNLFHDYYTNNLIRFISNAYKGKLSEYELDPSGQGINYKNFAEMVYIYYISTEYSPQEKIRLSSEMIKRVQESQFKNENVTMADVGRTVFYRDYFKHDNSKNLFSEDVLCLSEEDFEKFICEKYNCNTFSGNTNKGVLQIETEQVSAYEVYESILNELKNMGVALENCNYGLWFTDVAAFKKKCFSNICDRRPEVDRKKFDEFMELLLGINSFLGVTVDEKISEQNEEQEWKKLSTMKTKALYVDSKEAVTRTSIIVAFYYYFNAKHEADENISWKSFEKFFSEFKGEIDKMLDAAYYQRFSGKNIFDLVVAFSAYSYWNL